jgi:hypothetical protein
MGVGLRMGPALGASGASIPLSSGLELVALRRPHDVPDPAWDLWVIVSNRRKPGSEDFGRDARSNPEEPRGKRPGSLETPGLINSK